MNAPIQKDIDRFWTKLIFPNDVLNECWEYGGPKNSDGYGTIGIGGQMQLAHRYSYHIHFGIQNINNCICHVCDNPGCCNPNHLFEGSNLNNSDDKVNKGRQCKGEDVGLSKLTEPDIIDIRVRANGGETLTSIAKTYNINVGNLSYIVQNKTWKHVGGPITKTMRPRGTNVKISKLSETDVINIMELSNQMTIVKIAKQYNVGSTTISNIINGKTWRHITCKFRMCESI